MSESLRPHYPFTAFLIRYNQAFSIPAIPMKIDKILNNWFLIGLGIMLLSAFIFPELGEVLNPDKICTTTALILIFFITGISLNTESIKQGVKNVKLHIFLQLFIFVVCPLYFYNTSFLLKDLMDGSFIVGIYTLSCLPTTISTCVVFTSLTNGNIFGALFNSILANIFGIVITPVILTIMLNNSIQNINVNELLKIIINLLKLVMFPFVLGQCIHFLCSDFAIRNKNKFNSINSVLILLIIFFTFATTAANHTLLGELPNFIFPTVYILLSHILLTLLAVLGGKALSFSDEDLKAIIFTAPQKTLALGIPLLSTYFADRPKLLGIYALPIIIYHPWQLIIAGVIKNFLHDNKGQNERG